MQYLLTFIGCLAFLYGHDLQNTKPLTFRTVNNIFYRAPLFRSRKIVCIFFNAVYPWIFIICSDSCSPCAHNYKGLVEIYLQYRFVFTFNFFSGFWRVKFCWTLSHVSRFGKQSTLIKVNAPSPFLPPSSSLFLSAAAVVMDASLPFLLTPSFPLVRTSSPNHKGARYATLPAVTRW